MIALKNGFLIFKKREKSPKINQMHFDKSIVNTEQNFINEFFQRFFI